MVDCNLGTVWAAAIQALLHTHTHTIIIARGTVYHVTGSTAGPNHVMLQSSCRVCLWHAKCC